MLLIFLTVIKKKSFFLPGGKNQKNQTVSLEESKRMERELCSKGGL
jgi:hypothetical protein